jgi:hypothetical protein
MTAAISANALISAYVWNCDATGVRVSCSLPIEVEAASLARRNTESTDDAT